MNKQSLFIKLFVGALCLVVIVCAVNAVIALFFLNRQYVRNGLEQQTRLVEIARDHFIDKDLKSPTLQSRVRELFPKAQQRLTIIAHDGKVLADSQADPLKMENHKTLDRKEILAALNGKAGLDVRKSRTMAIDYRYLARPITKDGKVGACVRLAMPIGTLAEGKREIRQIIFYSGLAALIISAGAAGWFSWRWQNPMKKISEAAAMIASGDLSEKVNVNGSLEISELTHALNNMRRNLRNQIQTISAQSAQLKTIIETLDDSVIAVDENHVIVQANPAAVFLLSPEKKDIVGKTIQSVILNADIIDLYEKAQSQNLPAEKNIELSTPTGTHILDAHINPIESAPDEKLSMLIVLRDITRHAQLSKMKANFVANASHDLRTPITTLKTAVESLQDGIPDQKMYEKLVGIIGRHVARLEHLVDDLLDLHVIESQSLSADKQLITFKNIRDWIIEHFSDIAREKNIRLDVVIDDFDTQIKTNRILINSILQNLIENSLKFTTEGGLIEVILKSNDTKWSIEVKDTGCGIDPEHLDKVFERFYQVDSSRTGDNKLRGTGLGLAIVKHASEQLGTTPQLTSIPSQGTTVKIDVPKQS